ncbi:hypothetical protein CYCD_15730 [Tenuifilaceae bacterium CYCD]|nr:hypothetical protein CYCD_15730 [Tenuifilaceae bacterium CYCD]
MSANSAILYNTNSASMLYIKKREYLFLSIEGFANTRTLSELVEALNYGISHNHVKKIIFDTSKVKVIKKEDIQLLTLTLIPLLSKSAVSKIAFINSDDVFGNKSVSMLASIFTEHIPTQAFPNMESAEIWLFNN